MFYRINAYLKNAVQQHRDQHQDRQFLININVSLRAALIKFSNLTLREKMMFT